MERQTKTGIAFLVGLIVFLGVSYFFSLEVRKPVSQLPYYHFVPEEDKIEKSTVPRQKIGDFSFTNQLGQSFSQEGIRNTVFVADYFFVKCPGICKQMASQLQRVHAKFADREHFKILSHTSKPEEDSAEALMGYAHMYGVKDHKDWVFLTGDKKQLYNVARHQYFIVDEEGDGGEDDFIHTERFVLVDKNGYIRGYYDGTDPKDVDRLMLDIDDLLSN